MRVFRPLLYFFAGIGLMLGSVWGNSYVQNLYEDQARARSAADAQFILKMSDDEYRITSMPPHFGSYYDDWREWPTLATAIVIFILGLVFLGASFAEFASDDEYDDDDGEPKPVDETENGVADVHHLRKAS